MITGRKPVFKRLFLIFIVLAAVTTLLLGTIYANILYHGNTSKPLKSDVILVLGCHVNGSTPSLSLKYRLEKALELYEANYARYIIVSGGQGANEIVTEASAMKNWLVSRGVASHRIIEESQSSNTYENIKFSKELMEKKGFETAVIVSNDFHIFRSLKIASKVGVTASGAPAPTVWYLKLYYEAREVLSVIKGFMLDRI